MRKCGGGVRKFGKADVIYLSVLAVSLLLLTVWVYAGQSGGTLCEITVDGQQWGTFSLSQNQTVKITDEEGHVTNVLVIADGKAYMEEADCPDRLCVKQGKISADSQSIVCLPNRVVVTVKSGESTDLDAIVR